MVLCSSIDTLVAKLFSNSEMYTHRVIENITHYAHKINKLILYSMNLLTDSIYYCQIMIFLSIWEIQKDLKMWPRQTLKKWLRKNVLAI